MIDNVQPLGHWLSATLVSAKQRKYCRGVQKLSMSQLRPAKSPKLTGVASMPVQQSSCVSLSNDGHPFIQEGARGTKKKEASKSSDYTEPLPTERRATFERKEPKD